MLPRRKSLRAVAAGVAAVGLTALLTACNPKGHITLYSDGAKNPSADTFCSQLGAMTLGSRTFISQLQASDPTLLTSYDNRRVVAGGATYLNAQGASVAATATGIAGIECKYLGKGNHQVMLTYQIGTPALIAKTAPTLGLAQLHPPDATMSAAYPAGGTMDQLFWSILNEVGYV